MKKISSVNFEKYKKFKTLKISHICHKTLLLYTISMKCGSEDEKYISIEILNFWFNWKYIITLRIWGKSLDWKI